MKYYWSEQVGMSVGAGQIQRRYTCFDFVTDRLVGRGVTRYSACAARPPYPDGRTAMERRPYQDGRKRKRRASVLVCGLMKQNLRGSELAGCVDSHQTMANGKYLDYMLLQPVVDPVAVMVAENLADLRAFDFGECLSAHFGIVGKPSNRLHHLVFKPSSILGIEVAFKIFTVGSDAVLSALGYHDSHTAVRMRFVFDFALRSSRARRS